MNDWLAHLTAAGGRQVDERLWQFPQDDSPLGATPSCLSPLSHLGILECDGPDAARFLQGQTSANVEHANGEFAPLTTFCTPKGRMIANAELLKVGAERYWLLLDISLVAPLATQLGKYAPFYKVTLNPRDDLALIGVFGTMPSLPDEAQLPAPSEIDWHMSQQDDTVLVRHPGAGSRLLMILPQARAVSIWNQMQPNAIAVGNASWQRADIDAGVAWLTATHSDSLLPQMINWEALGGISFRKGCYTGQEIVARTHFRGQVKKRLQIATLEGGTAVEIGSEIRNAEGKRVGEVFQATPAGDAAVCDLLVVLNTSESEESRLVVDDRKLTLRELPYPLERLDPESVVAA
ncbi:CAF17-like 4Fe-4S cluster assembly/insertion protein YgfZ [Salinicola sp. V024]|uniref:CAF17-like 4Fe-4S cluster assembly/insertion protein YgfZ n=1 Tax=Salinicola sp. V024 TaxID=3459609 RepID=UPI00404485EC